MAQASPIKVVPSSAQPASVPEPSGHFVSPEAPVRPIAPVAFAMSSDTGRIRQVNEDTCGANPQHGAFLVCDGMGGAASGEVASQLARDTFLKSLVASEFSLAPARARLYEAIRAANQAVYRQAQRTKAQRGMGTTLVSVLIPKDDNEPPGTVLIAHVGDSRCYCLRAGALQQLTRDHSLIEEQIQAGLITRQEAAASPIRNIITRAVGTYATVEPEIAAHPLQPGDLLLLTSDGLTGELDQEQIAAHLRAIDLTSDPQSALEAGCTRLIEAANAHGGADNITVLLVAFS